MPPDDRVDIGSLGAGELNIVSAPVVCRTYPRSEIRVWQPINQPIFKMPITMQEPVNRHWFNNKLDCGIPIDEIVMSQSMILPMNYFQGEGQFEIRYARDTNEPSDNGSATELSEFTVTTR